jgi:hypothetical protein
LAAQISEPDFNRKLREKDCKEKHCMNLHFIFSSPIGGANKKGEALQKLCNSVETMPIYTAVATGKRNSQLYRERTRSYLK